MSSKVLRPRRSSLAVPGSSVKMLDKARGLKSDQLFMDLEDAVAPLAKADARKNIVQALNEGGYEDKIRAVRVNDWTTQWTYTDVIEIVEGAVEKTVAKIDAQVQSEKRQNAEERIAADPFMQQLEREFGAKVVSGSVRPA